ncbi:TetR/AcrR family transcriptional regulator [Vallitalea okinawensis]|uniref:TetR/AcrR family transcriptional regulator n=1 Tax=Vallitalea okinawensis TaxID=2078660 RepID=UPI000CFA8A95|nr:TetR/AcrR family transcriptional regulator [Vallitalea okinawensis]
MILIYKKSAKTEKRKADKKQKIYETSLELFLEKGYYNTSIRDIISKLDISIGSFYNYFANKEELFLEIYEDFSNRIFQIVWKATDTYLEKPLEYIVRSISITLLMIHKYRREAILLRLKEVGNNKLFEDNVRKFTEYAYLGTEKTLERFRDNHNLKIMDIKITAICFISSIDAIILYMLKNEVEQEISELAIPLISYNLNSLGIDFDKKIVETIYNELEKKFESDVFFTNE